MITYEDKEIVSLIKRSIKDAYTECIAWYKENVLEFFAECSGFSSHERVLCEYNNLCFSRLRNKLELAVPTPGFSERIWLAKACPQNAGAPMSIDCEDVLEDGVDAGLAFAFLYYAITGKPISTKEERDICADLILFEADLIDKALSSLIN